MGDPWQRWLTLSTRKTQGFHPWRYIPLNPSNDPYKFSFLPGTIPVWNSLPLHVVSSPTLDSFRLLLNTKYTAGFFNSPLFSLHNCCFAVTSCFLFGLQLALLTPVSDTYLVHTHHGMQCSKKGAKAVHTKKKEVECCAKTDKMPRGKTQ